MNELVEEVIRQETDQAPKEAVSGDKAGHRDPGASPAGTPAEEQKEQGNSL